MRSMLIRRAKIILVVAVISSLPSSPRAQEVFFGTADFENELLARPGDWSFVRSHVTGLYFNFITLGRSGQERVLTHLAQLLPRALPGPMAYLESDVRLPKPNQIGSGATAADDRRFIDLLERSGFNVRYTSLNYGWNSDRARLLREGGHPRGTSPCNGGRVSSERPNFVQLGPWKLGGDIRKNLKLSTIPNEEFRHWIEQAEGTSTDGPLGFWKVNHGDVRQGSISLVRWAHDKHKCAVVMLAPYGASIPDYDPVRDYLDVGKQDVWDHEDAGAVPDVWSVFEYATNIDAVPETIAGRPANTTAGLAYWLLNHIHDPQHALRMIVSLGWHHQSGGSSWGAAIRIRNTSNWLDLAPRLRLEGRSDISVEIDGIDVSAAADQANGVAMVGNLRLEPGSSKLVTLSTTGSTPPTIKLLAAPSPGADNELDAEVLVSR